MAILSNFLNAIQIQRMREWAEFKLIIILQLSLIICEETEPIEAQNARCVNEMVIIYTNKGMFKLMINDWLEIWNLIVALHCLLQQVQQAPLPWQCFSKFEYQVSISLVCQSESTTFVFNWLGGFFVMITCKRNISIQSCNTYGRTLCISAHVWAYKWKIKQNVVNILSFLKQNSLVFQPLLRKLTGKRSTFEHSGGKFIWIKPIFWAEEAKTLTPSTFICWLWHVGEIIFQAIEKNIKLD